MRCKRYVTIMKVIEVSPSPYSGVYSQNWVDFIHFFRVHPQGCVNSLSHGELTLSRGENGSLSRLFNMCTFNFYAIELPSL